MAFALVYLKLFAGLQVSSSTNNQIPTPFLVASLLLMFFTVLGTRAAFALPITLRANWIFRITDFHRAAEYLTAVRQAFYGIAVLPLWFALSVIALVLRPSWRSAVYSVALALVGIILSEIGLFDFHKLPFACAASPGRGNVPLTFWGVVFLLIPLAQSGGRLEARMLASSAGCAFLVCVLGLFALLVRRQVRALANGRAGVVFEEPSSGGLTQLALGRQITAPES